ncbi:MAG TPA: glucosamine-6-phosphate deaminase [Thermoguttaceae bacterium]|nr:glucosamine-6-phosphate deaminase [Thermoguttaceae bacterium]HUT88896.1 glucosamine-6-phosphate deaminase [Thermoguttaceae bacterium]
MQVDICETKQELGRRAAADGATLIREAIRHRGKANIILATGASQFEVLGELVASGGIDWTAVTAFHLDEYIGMPISHPASFRKYLKERFVNQLGQRPAAFHYIDGEADPHVECRRVGEIIRSHPIDVAFIGIGENGHLAFNDPPADFRTGEPYLVVDLDEACRRQQLGEGWFDTLDDVPRQAISMSIRQIMRSAAIICSVPDRRKAEAVRGAIEGPVTPELPASILQEHARAMVYLDRDSASLLQSGSGGG